MSVRRRALPDRHAVGSTAALARALADAGVGGRVVAAPLHDHVFVPIEGRQALAVLQALQHGR